MREVTATRTGLAQLCEAIGFTLYDDTFEIEKTAFKARMLDEPRPLTFHDCQHLFEGEPTHPYRVSVYLNEMIRAGDVIACPLHGTEFYSRVGGATEVDRIKAAILHFVTDGAEHTAGPNEKRRIGRREGLSTAVPTVEWVLDRIAAIAAPYRHTAYIAIERGALEVWYTRPTPEERSSDRPK